MQHPERPPAPTIIDVAVERERIAALEQIRRRLEAELDKAAPGYGYAEMARQLRDTVNAIADARNRIYESLLGEEPAPRAPHARESQPRESQARESPPPESQPPESPPPAPE